MGTIAATHNTNIDSLLSLSSWSSTVGASANLTYSFMTAYPSYASATEKNGWAPMSTAQQQAVATALAAWSAVANVTFTQIADGGYSGGGGNLRFATDTQTGTSVIGQFPTGAADQGNVYIDNTTAANASPTPGSSINLNILQGIAFALGLKDPDNFGTTPAPYLATSTDTRDYSALAQAAGSSFATTGLYPSGPMLYDIQAIQYLYGANTTYHIGNDTYSFTTNNAPVCVWDAGGLNTFDFSRCSGPYTINLNAGTFSSTNADGTGAALNNVSIAYGVSIQNAVGGSGGGTITCNTLNDTVTGGSGNDIIIIGSGSDTINGGGGSDTVRLTPTAHDISGDSIRNVQTLDMNGQTATMKLAQFNSFSSFLNTTGGVVFTDNGLISANPLVASYTLAAGGNTFNVISQFQPSTSVTAGAGNDSFTLPASVYNDNWIINGGGGTNALHFTGNYPFTTSLLNQISNIQSIVFDNSTANISYTAGIAMFTSGQPTLSIDATAQTTGACVVDASLLYATSVTLALGGVGNAAYTGGHGNDTIIGNGGVDSVTPGSGTDVIRAGSGLDVLVLAGSSGQYTMTQSGSTLSVSDSVAFRNGQDSVIGNAILQFTDKNVFLLNATDAAVAKLYLAAFGRLPDSGGLNAWATQYNSYVPAADSANLVTALAVDPVANRSSIAYDFTHSAEFINKYGSLSDSQYITQLYNNVLGRPPDTSGYNAWMSALAAGSSREQVLVGFAVSTEDASHTGGWLFAY